MDLSLFLRNEAKRKKFKQGNFTENFSLKINESIPKITFGVVYGFVVKLTSKEKENLFNEAVKLKGNKQIEISNIKPIKEDYYPLYWGKSSDVFGRITAHINGHGGGNSNLRLKQYSTLSTKKLYYSRLYVENSAGFEEYLIKEYPPILKTKKEII